MRPVYSSWLERLKEFQEAKRLVDLMLKAWVAVAREVAEDFPEEALREIAEEAKKVGLSAKKVASVVWVDRECGFPVLRVVLVLSKGVPWHEVHKKFPKMLLSLADRSEFFRAITMFITWSYEEPGERPGEFVAKVVEV